MRCPNSQRFWCPGVGASCCVQEVVDFRHVAFFLAPGAGAAGCVEELGGNQGPQAVFVLSCSFTDQVQA